MATKDLKLVIEPRSKTGTTGAQGLRAEGKIPAVIYGHGTAPEHVAIDAHVFEDLLHHGGRTGMITLTGGAGKSETALVREVQRHPVSNKVLHADLLRVSANEAVSAERPVVTVGVARGVKDSGGVMDVITHALEIEGPANQIPEHIEIDVTELGLHEHITAGDVKLPAGFKLLTPADQTVVAIEASRTERDVEEAATGPVEAAEPVVIEKKDEA
ncbi:MAG TPA: 50S ribosomal protein L25 [Candidatus Acidoferrales bacterium]|nr:50S ribosomal protein L25 [Candidatus Acidoferrales bacterium]